MTTRYDIFVREMRTDAETLAKALCQNKDFVWLDSACSGRFSLMAWQAQKRVEFFTDTAPKEFSAFLRSTGAGQGNVTENWASTDGFVLPITSGWIGWMNYEAAVFSPRLPTDVRNGLVQNYRAAANTSSPVVASFAYYDTLIITNTIDGRCHFVSRSKEAEELWRDVSLRVAKSVCPIQAHVGDINAHLKNTDYFAILAQIHQDICAGRYYEINFSQVFSAGFSGNPFAVYLAMRCACPASMMAFANTRDGAILSASPECFFRSQNGHIAVFPIKGTRPVTEAGQGRGADPWLEALLSDPKERAELLMITDLMRSDLGQVCKAGSVHVDGFPVATSHRHYHHLHAEISGNLAVNIGLDDIFVALFPGGSITGAPKIEVMRAISKYENRPRGIYTGAVGLIADNGLTEFNIAIRTVEILHGELRFATGGGIVYDSDPGREYEECLIKGAGICEALRPFQG